jgi:hypothetical protein
MRSKQSHQERNIGTTIVGDEKQILNNKHVQIQLGFIKSVVVIVVVTFLFHRVPVMSKEDATAAISAYTFFSSSALFSTTWSVAGSAVRAPASAATASRGMVTECASTSRGMRLMPQALSS